MKFGKILIISFLFWVLAALALIWAFSLELPLYLAVIRGGALGAAGLFASLFFVFLFFRPWEKKKIWVVSAIALLPLGGVATFAGNLTAFMIAGFDYTQFMWVYFFQGNLRETLLLVLFALVLEFFRKRSEPAPFDTSIALERNKKVTLLPVGDIYCIQSADDYVAFHTTQGEFLKRVTLKTIKEQLDPEQFVRIHKGAIVNINAIIALTPDPKGDFFLELKNRQKLRGSRRFKAGLKEKIKGL